MKAMKLFRSLSSTINIIYLVLTIIFTISIGSSLFYFATQRLSQNVDETMESVLDQQIKQLTNIYRDVFEQFYLLTQDSSMEKLANLEENSALNYLMIYRNLDGFIDRNDNIVSSVYININGQELAQSVFQQALSDDIQLEQLLKASDKTNEGYHWVNTHVDSLFEGEELVQSLVYQSSNQSIQAVVNIDVSKINNTLLDLPLEGSFSLLVDAQDNRISDTDLGHHEFYHDVIDLVLTNQQFEKNNLITLTNNSKYLYYSGIVGLTRWNLIVLTPQPKLFDSNVLFLLSIFLILVIFMTLTLLFLRMIKRSITNPINHMAEKMLTTKSIHEQITWPENTPNELTILYQTYNALTVRNMELINQITNEQEEKMELELALLHAQISPHFLYNTLYSIQGLSDMGMNKEASKMIRHLSTYLRTSLSRGREVIKISEEINNIESYLYMMYQRYGDYFKYEINIDERILDFDIVKLSMQPIVENAIYHGVMESSGKRGLILINAKEQIDTLEIYIEDNGKGIPEEELNNIKALINSPYRSNRSSKIGIGLRSVNIRIKQHFGDKYGIQIMSELGQYTKIVIRIPKIRGE